MHTRQKNGLEKKSGTWLYAEIAPPPHTHTHTEKGKKA